VQVGLTCENLTNTPLIYSVCYVNLWALEFCFGAKAPHDDGIDSTSVIQVDELIDLEAYSKQVAVRLFE